MVATRLDFPKELEPTLKLSTYDFGVIFDAIDYVLASSMACSKTIFFLECGLPETDAGSMTMQLKALRKKILDLLKLNTQCVFTTYELLMIQCMLKEIYAMEDMGQRKKSWEQLTFHNTDQEQIVSKIQRFFQSVTFKIQ
ncbi:MAG: hypothetical protein G01um101448_51 [Parcubacteria group bacterium Gr01-1014_48]|nr:MAG: hypothetical protein Greene041614_133 [Parcubacteria group bacterium Greene0416_14]TSC74532.1 MAG: hypothetical protein G01um101448_51 [Parcubacteria group bacterium Gr01-1014_48]TSD01408.1 MAG: hypothetical protein Greene101415_255 [Parcubacteria group bacterium Greene1014_15]TSD08450.1 MAG: hypothetical protein Greene07144_80 [Parcubacteria group bacterium Greene0714_4]